MTISCADLTWATVGCYQLDGSVDLEAILDELEPFGHIIDADENTGIMFSLDKTFLSTAKNLVELKADARHALPRPNGGGVPEVINVTRHSDDHVIDLTTI